MFVRKLWHTTTTYVPQHRELGVPMGVHVSFQLSALLQPDPAFPLLENVNRTKLVPLFWATEGFSTPTSWMVSTTNLALSLPSLGAQVDQHSASTLSPWKLTSPSTGDFHWSPAPGRCPYSHHTCHGCPCEVRSISAYGYGCIVFQKIHKYGTNEIMQMFPGGEANQERFWSHSNCLLPFVLPNFLLCHVQNID